MKYTNLIDAPVISRICRSQGEPGAKLVQVFYALAPASNNQDADINLRRWNLSMGWDNGDVADYLSSDIEKALSESYIELGRFYAADPKLEDLYLTLQGEMWSPNGEAKSLIRNNGLSHTSMSIGDVICIDGVAYYCDTFSFVEVRRN